MRALVCEPMKRRLPELALGYYDKHHGQNNVGRKGFVYSYSLLFITEGSPGKNTEQELKECCILAGSPVHIHALFLYIPDTLCLAMVPFTVTESSHMN